MVSGNRGESVAARALPQVINILMDLRCFPSWVLSPKDARSLLGLWAAWGPREMEAGLNGWTLRVSVKAFKQKRTQSGFNSSQVCNGFWAPTTCPHAGHHWEEGQRCARQTWTRVRPCLKGCFPHKVRSELCYVVEHDRKKKEKIILVELIWKGFMDLTSWRTGKVWTNRKERKTYPISRVSEDNHGVKAQCQEHLETSGQFDLTDNL